LRDFADILDKIPVPEPARAMPARHSLLLLLFPLLTGCEMLYDLLEIPDPKKKAAAVEAEGKAVGSACRHAGRSLEDCYQLNPGAQKAAVFAGWREMNDYMLENNLEVVPSKIPLPGELPKRSGMIALEPSSATSGSPALPLADPASVPAVSTPPAASPPSAAPAR
jgi:hypothetical protein